MESRLLKSQLLEPAERGRSPLQTRSDKMQSEVFEKETRSSSKHALFGAG
jgi:hypothetical protein